jgi:hypothetical protein
MKTIRIFAGVSATLAFFSAGLAHADATSPTAAPGTDQSVVLDTFTRLWVNGDGLGPVTDGVPRLEKNTGAGIMDANFAFDRAAVALDPKEVLLGTVYTRSSTTPNNANSYMQGGFSLAKLTAKGVELGATVNLPDLDGERAFMRPLIGFTKNHVVIIAASEDNGRNANPIPVMFVADKSTGSLVPIPNSTQAAKGPLKPTNLIDQAIADGIAVADPTGQRGPHSIVPVGNGSFVVGMQYNNRAAEAFRVTVDDNGKVQMNWLQRYSDTAQHCRPQVAIADGSDTGFIAEVEANQQPAEIGFRITKFNVADGSVVLSKIAVQSDPQNDKYVAEPSIGIVGDKLAVGYAMGTPARQKGANTNGHAGGSNVAMLALFGSSDLAQVGEPLMNAAPFGRHAHIFATEFGTKGEPAIAYIGGSSTGTKGGFEQLITLDAKGSLGSKDADKLFAVSTYSDVGNVQARGKRNPQNQAKGFINGLGRVPNPGFAKGATAFMPDVRTFSFSTVTGYTDGAGEKTAKRNSIWLSLVPAAWQEGLKVVPGVPTDKPGSNPDGTGAAPRIMTPPADNAVPASGAATEPPPAATDSGCAISNAGGTRSSAGLMLIALFGVLVVARRREQRSPTRWSLLLGLAAASAASGCAPAGQDPLAYRRSSAAATAGDTPTQTMSAALPAAGATTAPVPGTLPTASKAGEDFFAKELQPLLKATCAGCHTAGGIGNPTWIDANDAKKTYDMIYLQGYASADSRILRKGAHSSGGAPAVSSDERAKWAEWLTLESKEPGKPTQPNVLAKFGDCFDKAKFDAIGFDQLVVTARNAANNPQGITEDQDTCTGCRDNTRCSACHASDDVTGFVMAVGNTVLPADYTFQSSKKFSPPFIRQYVGTTPTGEPTYNPGIKTKSVNTIQKGVANGHPMFQLSDTMDAAIKAFVDDAIAKQKAGLCGK